MLFLGRLDLPLRKFQQSGTRVRAKQKIHVDVLLRTVKCFSFKKLQLEPCQPLRGCLSVSHFCRVMTTFSRFYQIMHISFILAFFICRTGTYTATVSRQARPTGPRNHWTQKLLAPDPAAIRSAAQGQNPRTRNPKEMHMATSNWLLSFS